MTLSETDIRKAFHGGDDDADNGLSVDEAVTAVEHLTGRSLDESDIKSACSSCGVSTSGREMTFDEFVSVVRNLEESGKL